MTYRTATEGQVVYYNNGQYVNDVCREKVTFQGYYKSYSGLVNPDRAVVLTSTKGGGDVPIHVHVSDLYKTNCKCDH